MATITLELFTSTKLKKEGDRHPVFVTVRHNGVPRRKLVGVAHKEEWDSVNKKIKPKGRKDHIDANIHIEDEFEKYKARFKALERSVLPWVADDVFKIEVAPEGPVTFYQFAEAYLNTLKKGTFTYDGTRSRFEKVKRFASRDFMISDIDKNWIANFINHCKTKEKDKKGGVGNAKNTINHVIKFIKRVVSYSGDINKALNSHNLSYDKNIKSKLTNDEINALVKLNLREDILMYHARNIFLVQFYFRGMRIGDALRLEWSDIKDGRLQYDAGKTGNSYDMKIVEPCMNILNKYRDTGGYYIFPFLRLKEPDTTVLQFKTEVKNRTMVINRNLKEIALKCGITKTVTTHIARHSFASIADQQLGGDLKTLQGLFGHSTREMTEIYIRDIRRVDDLDDAADKVLL
ncbi:site-specific integrase [Pedobacter lusitanus]|uniref:site-specific integrase n=1 Tax=Pedobacter lusitanus TaxID=1503925 RepID=UPI00069600BB|nr:site-specific integrase [Pedobacter lusitanus]